jgi:hypothetical protein
MEMCGSYDRRGFGLIKPSTSTVARARDEVMSKLFDDGAYAHQRLNLGAKGKAHKASLSWAFNIVAFWAVTGSGEPTTRRS